MRIVLTVCLLFIATASFAGPDPSQPTLTEKEIRAVDAFIKKQERIRSHKNVSLNRVEYKEARQYMLGDVNGDKVPDLVVYYSLVEGNTWNLFIAVFKRPCMQNPVNARVGGKGYRGIELSRVAEGLIEVKTKYYSPYDALCCPSVPGTSVYYLAEGALIEGEVRVNCTEWKPPERP